MNFKELKDNDLVARLQGLFTNLRTSPLADIAEACDIHLVVCNPQRNDNGKIIDGQKYRTRVMEQFSQTEHSTKGDCLYDARTVKSPSTYAGILVVVHPETKLRDAQLARAKLVDYQKMTNGFIFDPILVQYTP